MSKTLIGFDKAKGKDKSCLVIAEKQRDKVVLKYIKYFFLETEMGDMILELSAQATHDFMVYGYEVWDYTKELELNMKYQGYLK